MNPPDSLTLSFGNLAFLFFKREKAAAGERIADLPSLHLVKVRERIYPLLRKGQKANSTAIILNKKVLRFV
ncbi:MAG: hypothetical protein NTY48_04065 [Candidatus Diapherotrites archaeon]|nr:hypothetical protein [Candidatus Diapherotrites archaeon]